MPIVGGSAVSGTRVSARVRNVNTPGTGARYSTTASAGAWSLTLPTSADDEFYILAIDASGVPMENHTIRMPASGGPYTVAQVLSDIPTADPLPSLSSSVTLQSGKIVSGDHTVAAHAGWFVSPVSFEVAAAAGDTVIVFTRGMISWASLGSDYACRAVVSGSTILLREDSDTENPTVSGEGDPSLYPNPGGFTRVSGPFTFTVTSEMLSAGKLTVAFCSIGAGGMKFFASAGYPLHWSALVIAA